MLAPKKGLLCNLNHIHLQHVSLGLHLSRHPELQETSASMGGGDQTGCSDCPENCEQVDANSNNPSLKCQCCESHTQQPVIGLQNQAAQEDFPCLHAGERWLPLCDPPCDLASSSSSSSSVSSCSDFSLDDSPVSVFCKGFSREESQSPENQPDVIPIEDAQDGQSLADQSRTCDGRDASLNPPVLKRSDALAGESPDSLCSSTSLDFQCDETSPSAAVQETTSICADLDANCNSLPTDATPLAPPAPGRWDPSLSGAPELRPQAGSVPPPVPRPRRWLQVLNAHRAEQPLLPAEPEPSSGDVCRDAGKKIITSFHELAQKRKRTPLGPALAQARADRSDWLIVFSPDTELPPPSELLSSAACQEPARPQLQHDWPAKPPGSRQREVTTFKELRYRSASNKPKGQPAARGEAVASQHPPASLEIAIGSGGSGLVPPVPLGGHLLAPMESHEAKRRRSRPGLQPIAEGQSGDTEEGGLPLRSCLPGEKVGSGCGKDALVRRLRGPGEDPWVPGTVQRGDETCKEARPSPSAAAAAPGAARPGGGSTEGACRPRGEQKKALLIAVSTAVDKIITHFSTARNLVQKAQLGDSWLSPDVGYLLLHTLCPALYALVEDGLKPFQKDVITGQRKNSPWSVVEASVKTGPNTRSLHSLCWHVAELAPLNSTRQKFNAFILALNIKQLELWISHLQKSPGVISVLYSPMAFFALSQGPLPHLADELLLLIQPLSVLTFHLDLLFEHHHLSVDVRPLSHRLESPLSPAHRAAQARGPLQPSLEGQSGAAGASLEDEIPPDALGRAAGAEGSTRSQSQAAVRGLVPGQVGAALQQTFQHVLRWGDQLSRTFLGADSSLETHRPEAGPQDAGAGLGGWWGQLSQASRIYTAPSKEKFPFAWYKLRTAAGDSSPGQVAQPHVSVNDPRGTELQLLQTKAVPELSSSKPSSSADTSGTSSPEDLVLPAGAGAPTEPDDPAAGEKLLAASPEPHVNRNWAAPADPEAGSPPGPDKGSWLGRLFGATSPSARSFPPSPDAISARSRRPSSWLSPSAHVLAVVVKGLVSEKTRAEEQPESNKSDVPQPHRAVRALCDHTGTAAGHLSFQKGDILQLLSTVDEDWIHCCHGNSTGLVPVSYTSLIL
ncbi:LOW QUALITY PROTEIN: AP-4 complex accessory subunit RUSC1 [Phoenicopterus ruber ruber]